MVDYLILQMTVEAPFRPREKLFEKQKYYQNIHKHTYLKGPMDIITSRAIPAALAATSLFLIGRGIYNMSHGIGKME
ncbi:oxidase [Lithospermum erythrorhizon]|uniref:Oxidase n=1 Tax=Lithospermum erythrorhizon TaxID=34254 RepID=A0AAV3QS29_LITER